jgi:hypothetical protein
MAKNGELCKNIKEEFYSRYHGDAGQTVINAVVVEAVSRAKI